MPDTLTKLKKLIKELPDSPGVYKMKDSHDHLLYVGKAKSLKKRVSSYFRNDKNMSLRTKKLVEKINDIEWIEVGSDLEAIFLETNLIKEHKPKYNILMKDDKNFVYLKITKNEDYPRVEIVRKVHNDGSKYFGPKTASHKLEKTLDLLQKIFNFRTCNLNIQFLKIGEVKVTNKVIAYPCLLYHIKKCEAPCIGNISPEDYIKNILQIENFFKGNTSEIEKMLTDKMKRFAEEKNFEMAAKTRDKLNTILELSQKQIITSPDHSFADVVSFVIHNEKAYFNVFNIREGKIINNENFILDIPGIVEENEDDFSEIIESFLFLYYENSVDFPNEILIPNDLINKDFFQDFINNQSGRKIKIFIPQKGRKHALLDLAKKNADSFKKQYLVKWGLKQNNDDLALEELKNHLKLEKILKRIECYDISHLSGTDTVASMVVFENGKPKNADYRKFKLKSIKNGEVDDFKSLKEVLFRRLIKISNKNNWIKKVKNKNSFQLVKNKKILNKLEFEKIANFFVLNIDNFTVSNDYLDFSLLHYSLIKIPSARIYLFSPRKLVEYFINFGFEEIKNIPDAIKFCASKNAVFLAFDKNKNRDESFESKPDLIVIDGGKGQLSSVMDVVNDLGIKIPVISLAKKEEEVYSPGSLLPLQIPKKSQALFLLMRMRDEAHRFAITYQKSKRTF